MGRSAAESLKGQTETLVAAATAAAAWFRRPAPSALSAARTARLRALGWREAAVTANKAFRGLAKTDAADASFALREAVEHSAQAVSEAVRYGVEPDDGLVKTADAVREAAKALAAAAAGRGKARAEALILAKKWAGEAERLRRLTRSEAHELPSLMNALKRETVSNRLSNAAEAMQQACDALAGGLVG
ncbi:MAG: hypothetical protein HYX59_04675 [Elusimicrobia bacterium]|nr:hypothetical protein [Elusimicrobiota bacterium]